MKKIIKFSPPDITEDEINEVVDTLRSGWITTGPKTKLFEQKIAQYIGTNKAVCLNSATAALELALVFLGVGPGDEVITSAYTYTASAAVISHVGAKIVLVDTQKESYEMDYDSLSRSINSRTKVIIPVDIAGIPCDYKRIFDIVNEKQHLYCPTNERQEALGRITVLSDSAHSFGAQRDGIISGLMADITCFSFHAVKNLTTAEGGALVWKSNYGLTDEEMYKEFMLLSLHGQSKDALSKTSLGLWEYDIIYTGYKCNMTDILASIGLVQLSRYKSMLDRRFELVKIYENSLDKNKFIVNKHRTEPFISSAHLLMINIKNADEIVRNKYIEKLAIKGIATNVHYKPLPMFTAYKKLGFNILNYPNAYNLYKSEITLPLHTLLTDDDVKHICQVMNSIEV